MDKIARLRQEIERRINILTNVYDEQMERKDEEMMNYYHGKVIALEELRPFLDTLSEEPDKSLEEEIEKCWKDWLSPSNQPSVEGILPKSEFIMYARHFAQWGAEHFRDTTKMIDKSLEEAAENIYKIPFGTRAEDFIAGAEWQASQMPMPEDTVLFQKGVAEGKRLMMEDAVEGEVIKTDKHTSVRYKSFYGTDRYFYGIADKQFKPGDKVHIVVLKEEEK